MIKVGMMVTNESVGVVGRVIYTDETTTAVEVFTGKVHEVATTDCEEVSTWVRLQAWMLIAKKLRSFFIRRMIK